MYATPETLKYILLFTKINVLITRKASFKLLKKHLASNAISNDLFYIYLTELFKWKKK